MQWYGPVVLGASAVGAIGLGGLAYWYMSRPTPRRVYETPASADPAGMDMRAAENRAQTAHLYPERLTYPEEQVIVAPGTPTGGRRRRRRRRHHSRRRRG